MKNDDWSVLAVIEFTDGTAVYSEKARAPTREIAEKIAKTVSGISCQDPKGRTVSRTYVTVIPSKRKGLL